MPIEGSRAEPEMIIQRSPVWVRTHNNWKSGRTKAFEKRSRNDK